MSARCPTCGTPNLEGASFCVACGRSLSDVLRPGSSQSAAAPASGVVCASCNTPNVAGNVFCVQCGKLVKALGGPQQQPGTQYFPQPAPPPPARYGGGQPTYMPSPQPWMTGPMGLPIQKARPLGITILAVLDGLGAAILLLVGLFFLVSGAAADALLPPDADAETFRALGPVLGMVMLVLGGIYGYLAIGLWKGKGWAWTVSLVLQAIGVFFNIISLASTGAASVFGLLINALVLWYLMRPHVKYFFDKGPAPVSQPQVFPSTPPPPPS